MYPDNIIEFIVSSIKRGYCRETVLLIFNQLISLYIYYDQCEKYGGKKFPVVRLHEIAVIFDFRALTKVHITLNPLLQMQ